MNGKRKEKTVEVVSRLKCPACGKLSWGVDIIEKDGIEFGLCRVCKIQSPIERFNEVEEEMEVIKCPVCGNRITITEENWSWGTWSGPEPVVLCNKCKIPLQGYIHHENPRGPTIEVFTRKKGGYQEVFHENCPNKDNDDLPIMDLVRITVDANPDDSGSEKGASRVVLVFECEKCGDQQVIKFRLFDTRIFDAENKMWWIHPKYSKFLKA